MPNRVQKVKVMEVCPKHVAEVRILEVRIRRRGPEQRGSETQREAGKERERELGRCQSCWFFLASDHAC